MNKKDDKRGKNRITHGMTGSRIYRTWKAMKTRCHNEHSPSFKNYGGRGITVCDEWKNDFQSFYEYVSKLEYFGEPGRTLDRINNDGNYEPGNVRWATRKEQQVNRRRRMITIKGESHNIKEWSEIVGVNVETMRYRINHNFDESRLLKGGVKKHG